MRISFQQTVNSLPRYNSHLHPSTSKSSHNRRDFVRFLKFRTSGDSSNAFSTEYIFLWSSALQNKIPQILILNFDLTKVNIVWIMRRKLRLDALPEKRRWCSALSRSPITRSTLSSRRTPGVDPRNTGSCESEVPLNSIDFGSTKITVDFRSAMCEENIFL
jgi:hypothetical protein